MEKPQSAARVPPDGGWGWMVVFGAALINMVNQAMFANFGLIFGEYLKEIGGGHATGITLVLAISVVVTNCTGLIVGPLLKILDIRTFTFIGIGFVGSGMIVSSFGTATWHIVIGYSIMTEKCKKTNAEQYKTYLTFLQKYKTHQNIPEEEFEKMCMLLNKYNKGPSKSKEEWHQTFREWTSKTKRKAREIFRHQQQTGGGPPLNSFLSELENWLMNILDMLVIVGMNICELGLHKEKKMKPTVLTGKVNRGKQKRKSFGLGLLASGTFLVINDYFTTKKSTAVGISMAGTAVGQMTMPLFIGMLLKKYEYSGTTFILGFVSYSGVIGAAFFKPMFCCKRWVPSENDVTIKNASEKPLPEDKNEVIAVPTSEEEEKLLLKNSSKDRKDSKTERNVSNGDSVLNENKRVSGERKISNTERKLSTAKGMIKSYSQGILKSHIEDNYKESAIEMANSEFKLNHEDKKQNWLQRISKTLGFDLLKDPIYVHIVFGLGLVYVSTVSFGAFYPIFLQDEFGLTVFQTTTTMTSLSSADVLGRVTASEICRRMKISNRKFFMFGAFMLSIMRSINIIMPEYISLTVVAFLVGYFRAVAVINQNLVISEYISKEKLPSAVGLNMVTKAILSLTLGQSLGLLKDLWSYSVCIHILNLITIVVVVSWTLELFIRHMRVPKTTLEEVKVEFIS